MVSRLFFVNRTFLPTIFSAWFISCRFCLIFNTWHIPIVATFVIELLLLFRHLHIVVHFANIFLGFLVQFRLCYHTFFYQVLIIFQFLWSEFDNSIVIIFKVKLAFLAIYPGIFIGSSLLYKFLTHWLIRSIRIFIALILILWYSRGRRRNIVLPMRVRSVADSTFIVSLCKKGIAGGSDRWICTPIIEQCSFYFCSMWHCRYYRIVIIASFFKFQVYRHKAF